MTAEIGLLNKTSVVLAADSAVTIGSANKVFNNANKLFPLSYYEPVGIMVYNNASWMGIPFEIIIKSYTKHLGKKSFETLEEYRNDFITFIKANYQCFVTQEQIKDFIEYRLYNILETIMEVCNEIFNEKYKSRIADLNPKERKELFEKLFLEIIDEVSKIKTEILPDFKDYKIEEFKTEFKNYINKILPKFYTNYNLTRNPKYTSRIYKQLFNELVCNFSESEDYAGLVIAGYGKNEIFPSICDVKIGEVFSKRLRYEFSTINRVSHDSTAIVRPYAQRDMVDTFFQGINPSIIEELNKNILPKEFENLIEKISKKYDTVNKSEIRQLFKGSFKSINESIRDYTTKKYIKPIITSIGYLRKEDLIELAESLINITSLKRKTSEAIQTVGGPIDIAIITKHEGFVWVKRKDLVNKELNSIFFHRELKDL